MIAYYSIDLDYSNGLSFTCLSCCNKLCFSHIHDCNNSPCILYKSIQNTFKSNHISCLFHSQTLPNTSHVNNTNTHTHNPEGYSSTSQARGLFPRGHQFKSHKFRATGGLHGR